MKAHLLARRGDPKGLNLGGVVGAVTLRIADWALAVKSMRHGSRAHHRWFARHWL